MIKFFCPLLEKFGPLFKHFAQPELGTALLGAKRGYNMLQDNLAKY